MSKHPAHRCRRKPPYFYPAPLRARRDRWSVVRQCVFLAQLYPTGSVQAATRAVGLSRASAYQLRERAGAEDFAHAWDCVLDAPGSGRQARPKENWRMVTDEELIRRVRTGRVQPVIYRGRVTAIRRKPQISVLLRLLRRQDANRSRKV